VISHSDLNRLKWHSKLKAAYLKADASLASDRCELNSTQETYLKHTFHTKILCESLDEKIFSSIVLFWGLFIWWV